MRRVTGCGRTTMMPVIRFALRNSLNSCSTTKAWLRRVPHEDSFAIANNNSSMKHVEMLARRHKKNQFTGLQVSFESWHCALRHTFHASPLCGESRHNVQDPLPTSCRDIFHCTLVQHPFTQSLSNPP